MNRVLNVNELHQQLSAGDRGALGRAITLVESHNPEHRVLANDLLDLCLLESRRSFRFAISGSPGVGKSTMIETLGNHIIQTGETLAVLAVDPTSAVSQGAILGDKTRMNTLSTNQNVFIRPSPAGKTLGGVADATREAIVLCEAAGYQNICIETVGVGQSEIAVRNMCDFMLLLLLPGGGDDLQGIKRGIVELADMIAINKSDGPQEQLALKTRQHYMQATHFLPEKEHGQPVKVVTCSALKDKGIDGMWSLMSSFAATSRESGYMATLRREQSAMWLQSKVDSLLGELVLSIPEIQTVLTEEINHVTGNEISVSTAYSRIQSVIRQTLGI